MGIAVTTIIRELSLDIGLPVATYFSLNFIGVTGWAAMLAATLVAVLRLIWVAVRGRTLNPFAMVMAVVFGLDLALYFVTGDARVELIKGSITEHRSYPSTRKGQPLIDGVHVAEARIGMPPAPAQGPRFWMPSGGRPLLLKFRSLENPDQQATIGTVIDTLDGSAIEPGITGVIVRLWFCADEAQVYATPGTKFLLWYAGQTVGHGEVLRAIDEVADSTP